MFEFTIRENALLNEFKDMFADYVNKAYKFTMSYISNPILAIFANKFLYKVFEIFGVLLKIHN